MMKMQGSIRRKPTSRLNFAGLRRYPRKNFISEVLVQDRDGWEIPVESIDFSPSGMFLRSNFLFEVGTIHTLIFIDPDGGEIFSIRAQVVRVETQTSEQGDEAGGDFVPGMAYEFVDLREQKRKRLFGLAARV